MSGRILLLSAQIGAGHLQAARAVARACEQHTPEAVTFAVNLENRFIRLLTAGYLELLRRMPSAWRMLYHAPVGSGSRLLIRAGLQRLVLHEAERMRPTAVAATHPFPGAAAAHLRLTGALQAPLAMVLTDFAPHPVWVHPGVDQYFVASDQAAARLSAMGADPTRITVAGIPIRPGLAARPRPTGPGGAARILVMGGGLGLGPLTRAADSLAAQQDPLLTITLVCGANDRLRRELAARYGQNPRILVTGYASHLPELMRQADLLVTKPGGLTASEALAMGLPMLLLNPLPGHEEENAAWLTGTGAAAAVPADAVGEQALAICRSERLLQMQACARAASHPEAAQVVARFLLAAAGEQAREAAAATC